MTWASTGSIGGNRDASLFGVYARMFQADGTAVGSEFKVNTTTVGSQLFPTVGMNTFGRFVIAWTSLNGQDGSGAGVYAQQFNADGTPLGGEFLVNTTTQGTQTSPSVAVDGLGNFVVVWQDTGNGSEIRGQYFLSSGAPSGTEFTVNETPASAGATNCSVSMADDGRFVVAWASTGTNAGVYTRQYAVGAVPAGPDNRVSTSGGGRPIGLDVDSDGDFVVTWESPSNNISARKFNSTGVAAAGVFQVNTNTPAGQPTRVRTSPRVGLAESGRVFVTWLEVTSSANDAIWMREFRPDQSADGAEIRVNTQAGGVNNTFGPSSVAVDGEGDILVVWQTDTTIAPAIPTDIHGQLYNRARRPTDINLAITNVDENLPAGTGVSVLTTTDLDSPETFTYKLVGGLLDNGFFSISGNQLLTANTFDFEDVATYSIVVEVTDSWNYHFQKTFTINVDDVNEAPTLTPISLTVPENSPQGFVIGTLKGTDPDFNQLLVFTITAGNANAAFALNPATGILTVNNPALLNYEAQQSVTLSINVTDNGSPRLSAAGNIVVTVTNVNEKPTSLTLLPPSVPENQPVGALVGTLSTVDPDVGDSQTYTLVTGSGDNDNAKFQISGNEVLSAAVFDFETKASYKVRIRTTDAQGLSFEKPLVIVINNLNEQPTLGSANFNLPENSTVGTVVGQLVANDVDVGQILTYSIVSGNTGNAFSVNSQGQLLVANSAALDFETVQSFALMVKVSDTGNPILSQTAAVNVTLSDVFETPTAVAVTPASVLENQPSVTLIGVLTSTDSDIGETYTYALVNGSGSTDNGLVNIVGNQLFTSVSLNREAKSSLSVRILTTDSNGQAFQQALTIAVANVNETPTALQLSAQTVAENLPASTLVGTLSTVDPDVGDGFTYSLFTGVNGPDNGQFSIVGNQLITNSAFNFEAKNSYSILVRTTDVGGLHFDQAFVITVSDVNDAPQLGNVQYFLDENSPAGQLVGTLAATDADPGTTFTYSLTGGNIQTAFSIDPATGALKVANAAAINFELRPSYDLTVMVRDNGNPQLSATAQVTVTINDLNESPTSLGLTHAAVDENLPAGTVVGNFTKTDPDAANTFTFSLIPGVGDTGNSSFVVDGNQLKTAAVFNREAQSTYSILARVTDQGGRFFNQVLTITVNNINEGPTAFDLAPSTVPETKPAGIRIGTFSTTDVDVGDTFSYVLEAGQGDNDNGIFTIVGNELLTTTVLDFESRTHYSIRVRTTDHDGLSFARQVDVDVTERNEAPTGILLSAVNVAENMVAGTPIGNFTAIDEDLNEHFTYQLVPGTGSADNLKFSLTGDQLATATSLDFETNNRYFIRVRVTDHDGQTYERPFTIHVSNVNDAPTDIVLSPNTIAENAAVNTVVGILNTVDPDFTDTFTYSLVSSPGGNDNAFFRLNGQQVILQSPLDFELKSHYFITVKSEDAGHQSVEKTITINVSNANDAPTGLGLSKSTIAENAPQGAEVGIFQPIDPDANETFTYSLVPGDGALHNSQFLINGNQLLALTSFNFETDPTRSIRVRVTDGSGTSFFERSFVIGVTNVNENPTGISLSSNSIDENQPVGTVVGNLLSTDLDANNTFTYTIVPVLGSNDHTAFAIAGQQLVTAASLNFEGQKVYNIRIRTTDAGGLSFDKPFTINVNYVAPPNQAPSSLTLGSNTIAENVAVGTRVGSLQATDPDVGDLLTFSLVAGTGGSGNDQFQIVGNELRTAAVLDYEAHHNYSVLIRVTDSHGATLDRAFILNVLDGAESPKVRLAAQARAVNRREIVAIDEHATLEDTDSPSFDGGMISVTLTGGPASDVLKLRSGSDSEGRPWTVTRGGVVKIANVTVATINGGTRGRALEIHFLPGVDRRLAEGFLQNITFLGKTAGRRTATVTVTDNTGLFNQPAATRQIDVT